MQKAIDVAREFNLDYRVVETENQLLSSIENKKLAITTDSNLIASCPLIDVFVESSNSICSAAQSSIAAVENGKHLILMNSEIDLIYGPYFSKLAKRNNVVLSSCDGDQHTVLKRMINQIELWGFDIVMAGNIKGFLDRYSNPTKIIPEADKRNLGYKMATAYTDGTKLCIEMALVANNLGLKTMKPGMTGHPTKSVHEVFDLFDFPKIHSEYGGVVDYVVGAEPGGGVFVVGYHENPYQKFMLDYYKMGKGPYYLFYRPYHLCHLESMECIAEACLYGESLLEPEYGYFSNVYSYAKTDMKSGDILDGIGGYNCYGMIENNEKSSKNSGLPICIAENMVLKVDKQKDDKIFIEDVIIELDNYEFNLYQKSLESKM